MIFLLILAAVFGLDYAVKKYVEEHKKEGQQEEALGGAILIRRMSNYGAAGSIMKNNPERVKWASGLVMFFASIQFVRALFKKGNTGLKLCYSLLLGGGLSNLYDRIKKGAVTDYFSFRVPVKKIRNLVFNISDMFIIIGSAALFVLQLKQSRSQDGQ